MTNKSIGAKVYHASVPVVLSKISFLLLMLGVGVLVISLGGAHQLTWTGVPLLVLYLVVTAALVFLLRRHIYLVVSADGLEYRSMGFGVRARWEQVQGIGTRRIRGEGKVEGLVLAKPDVAMSGILKFSARIDDERREVHELYYDFIPLSAMFTRFWRDTEAGRDVRRYLPHLFNEDVEI